MFFHDKKSVNVFNVLRNFLTHESESLKPKDCITFTDNNQRKTEDLIMT